MFPAECYSFPIIVSYERSQAMNYRILVQCSAFIDHFLCLIHILLRSIFTDESMTLCRHALVWIFRKTLCSIKFTISKNVPLIAIHIFPSVTLFWLISNNQTSILKEFLFKSRFLPLIFIPIILCVQLIPSASKEDFSGSKALVKAFN